MNDKETWSGHKVAAYIIKRENIPTDLKPLSTLSGLPRLLGDQYSRHKDTVYLSRRIWSQPGERSVAVAAHEVGHALQKHRNFSAMGVGVRGLTWIDRWFYPVFLTTAGFWAVSFLIFPNLVVQVATMLGLILCILMRPCIDRMETDASKRALQCLLAYDSELGTSLLVRLGLDEVRIRRHLKRALRTYRINHLALGFFVLVSVFMFLSMNFGLVPDLFHP